MIKAAIRLQQHMHFMCGHFCLRVFVKSWEKRQIFTIFMLAFIPVIYSVHRMIRAQCFWCVWVPKACLKPSKFDCSVCAARRERAQMFAFTLSDISSGGE